MSFTLGVLTCTITTSIDSRLAWAGHYMKPFAALCRTQTLRRLIRALERDLNGEGHSQEQIPFPWQDGCQIFKHKSRLVDCVCFRMKSKVINELQMVGERSGIDVECEI